MRCTVIIALACLMCGCDGGRKKETPAPAAQPQTPAPQPPAPKPAPTGVVSGPLGSKTNPVKCDYPEGERAYLSRLRGPGGASATFNRTGSAGPGPYGHILDHYSVTCGGKTYDVYMDMYFKNYVEKNPIPRFTIVK